MAESAEGRRGSERLSYGSCLVLLCVADEPYILLMNQCARVPSGVEHGISKRLLGYFGPTRCFELHSSHPSIYTNGLVAPTQEIWNSGRYDHQTNTAEYVERENLWEFVAKGPRRQLPQLTVKLTINTMEGGRESGGI